jgi:lysophospholipase L1-like esterase
MYAYAIKEHNEHLRQLAREEGYVLADAYSEFLQRPELLAEFSDGVHMSKEGNRAKAEVVTEALLREWGPLLEEGIPLDDPDEDR